MVPVTSLVDPISLFHLSFPRPVIYPWKKTCYLLSWHVISSRYRELEVFQFRFPWFLNPSTWISGWNSCVCRMVPLPQVIVYHLTYKALRLYFNKKKQVILMVTVFSKFGSDKTYQFRRNSFIQFRVVAIHKAFVKRFFHFIEQ